MHKIQFYVIHKNYDSQVWGIKERIPFLNNEIRPAIINHIKTNANSKGIFIDRINGHSDHFH